MAIDPTTTTTIRVGELQSAAYSTTDLIPHEVGGYLKKGNLLDLAHFVKDIIDAEGAIGFRAVEIEDGQTLPATDSDEFILVGPGTFPNVGGGATITTTEPLNALVSNGTFWFIGVEIPITASGVWGTLTGVLSDQTDLYNVLVAKADLIDGKVPNSQLPSYVDDVVEVASYEALPVVGEAGKIYITLNTGNIYRWSGSIYIRIANEAAAWGTITGTLSDQTDLQSSLNAKALKATLINTSAPLSGGGDLSTDRTISISQANTTTNGFLSSTDWNTFNNKVPTSRTISINGTSYDLSANRSWTIPTHDAVTIGTANGLSLVGQVLSLATANPLNTGALSAGDWATFNSKQSALNGTGFVKVSGTTVSYDNSTYALDSAVVKLTGDQTIAGNKTFSNIVQASAFKLTGMTAGSGALYWTSDRVTLANYNTNGVVEIEALGGSSIATFGNSIDFTKTVFVSSNLYANGIVSRGTPANTLSYLSGSGAIFVRNTADETAYAFQLNTSSGLDLWSTNSGGTSTRRLTLDSSGNVGIGTTSPASLLHIKGSGYPSLSLEGATNSGAGIKFLGDVQYAEIFGEYESATNGQMFFRTRKAGTISTAMTILSSGNVGIGTTSPGALLDVNGSIYSRSGSILSNNFGGYSGSDVNFTTNTSGGANLIFSTVLTPRMIITSGGSVMVNLTSTGPYLDGKINVFGNSTIPAACFKTESNSQFTTSFWNAASGTVVLQQFVYGTGQTLVGSISSNGTITSYNITSDYRLKQDFKQFNGLDLVSKIKVYDYEWKSDKSRMNGVIAHELQEVVPYAVTGEKDAEQMQSVDYSKLVPILVQAIQELKAEIEILKNK